MLISAMAAGLWKKPYGRELDDEAWYGQSADVICDLGEYCLVRMSYGYESYIERRHLHEGEYPKDAALVTVRRSFADVMDAPSYQAGRLMTLPMGAVAEAHEGGGGWTQLKLLDGRAGFVRTGHIAPHRAPRGTQEEMRKGIIDTALSYMGVQYRWGGRTHAGVDCSGLCHAAYLLNGVAIYRNARIAEGYPVHSIPMGCIGPGDLIYFEGHMAMYLGESRYLHATGRAGDDCVRINSLDPGDVAYREDLAQGILCTGSIF